MREDAPAALDQVLNEEADWHGIAGRPYHFAATIAGASCELRLNDFPDENIATLWIRGERHELEEFPPSWRFATAPDP